MKMKSLSTAFLLVRDDLEATDPNFREHIDPDTEFECSTKQAKELVNMNRAKPTTEDDLELLEKFKG